MTIKVLDKRIFTPEGDLREEYRDLEASSRAATPPGEATGATAQPVEPAAAEVGSADPAGQPREDRAAVPPPPAESWGAAPAGWDDEPPRLELPGTPPGLGAPTFYDLVGILAEPVALYLGDVPLPDGESAENLEMARLHIDLLDVLRQKTAANLTAQEAAVLEDVLYRLRLRYVHKRG